MPDSNEHGPAPEGSPTPIMSPLRRFVAFCRGHHWALLVAVVVLTTIAGLKASDLSVDASFQRLLPQTAPSVASLERLQTSYQGSLGRLVVLLEDDDTERLKETAVELTDDLERLEDVERVEYLRPEAFFKEYRFLYLDYSDLQTVKQRFERRIRWERERANPLFVGLDDEQPPEIDVSDIVAEYDGADGSDYYLNDRGNRLALFVFPTFSADEFSRSKQLTERVDELVSDRLASAPGDTQFSLTGRYKKRVDLQQLLGSDLTTATIVAVIALALFMLVLTRSVTALFLIILPLVTGTIWTFAWAEIAFDSLNFLTGFLGAILLGLGVDYGIHLHFRYTEYQRAGSVDHAVLRTLLTAGRANLFAGFTTMVPMAALILSEFRAFYEFGLVAVGGLVMILAAYGIMYPCLVFAFASFGLTPREPVTSVIVDRTTTRMLSRERRLPDFPRRLSRWLLLMMAALTIPAVFGANDLRFNRDLYVLQSTSADSWRLDDVVNEILGRSQTPAVILTDSPEHTRQVVDELERRREEMPEGETIGDILSLQKTLPDRQSDKLELLRDLDAQIDELPEGAIGEGKLARYADELDRVLAEAPITTSDLPVRIKAPFRRTEAGLNTVVLVFPAVDLTDTGNVEQFVQVLSDLPGIEYEGEYDAVSEALLMHDIIRYIERDAPRMLLLTLFGLLLISLLAFRRPYDSALQFTVLLPSLAVALGWIGMVGVTFNFLNVMIVPIWLGLAIDATFHMIFNLREHSGHLATHLTTSVAVAAAFLTTMIGFGSLLLAHHNGLYSLGRIAIWGLGLLMVANLLAYLFMVSRTRTARTDTHSAGKNQSETSKADASPTDSDEE